MKVTKYQKILVTQLVEEYERRFPSEAAAIIADNKMIRETNYNKWGEGKAKAIRSSLGISRVLMDLLKKNVPDWVWDRDQSLWFVRTFPHYSESERENVSLVF